MLTLIDELGLQVALASGVCASGKVVCFIVTFSSCVHDVVFGGRERS